MRGFTLLELLVAMVLLALLMSVLTASGRLIGKVGASVESRAEALAALDLGLDQVRWRLAAAELRNVGGVRFRQAFEGDADGFRFVALRPAFEQGWPLTAFGVDIVEDGRTSALTLRLTPLDPKRPDLDVLDKAPARVLFTVPAELELAYLERPETAAQGRPGAGLSGGRGAWRQAWNDPLRAPQAVRLAAPRRPDLFPTTLFPLDADLPSFCASDQVEDTRPCGY